MRGRRMGRRWEIPRRVSCTGPVGLLCLVLCALLGGRMASAQQTDADLLLDIKAALGGTTSATWSGTDPCGVSSGSPWQGVGCRMTSSTPQVTSLNLAASGASGTIPTSVFALHSLTSLNLGGNRGIGGTIPDAVGSLFSLEYLDLHSCSMSGGVPGSLTRLSALSFLALNDNVLSGRLPPALGSAGQLFWLDVVLNNISGPVPESLSLCSSLAHLHLSYNQLDYLPTSLTVLQNLVHILVDNNRFSQPFPTGFNSSRKLMNIRLTNNNWTVPSLPSILPSSLVELYASNAFSQPMAVPDLSDVAPGLQIIELADNGLNGPLPASMTALKDLYSLSMRNNNVSSTLPLFNGTVQRNLQLVDLQNNSVDFVPLAALSQPGASFSVLLAGNPVCDGTTIPSCTQNTSLPEWSFDVPTQCVGIKCPAPPADRGVITFNPVAYNRTLQCTCASPLVALLKLNSPAFSFFDDSLAVQMEAIVLKCMQDAGVAGMEVLDQVNVFMVRQEPGNDIPFFVTLYFFPVDADTPLDTGAIKQTLLANKLFLGMPFGLQYAQEFQDPVSVPAPSQGMSAGAIAGITVGCVVAVVAVIALVGFLLVRHKKQKVSQEDMWTEEDEENLQAIKATGVERFQLQEMLDATKNFSTKLGEGGYGQVYRGTLPAPDGREVAVKRADEAVHQGGQAFRNEIELLSRVRHRNLVALLGFCRTAGEQLLVYEFVPQGSLQDWLHGAKKVPGLTWAQRLRAAEGAARGLAYLHNNIEPSIIHRDVKPDNILLTESLDAKVADFGLSRLVHERELVEQDSGGVDTRVAGTVGYLDPEYSSSGILTAKSDVYSLGVVLLEMATGRQPRADFVHVRAWVAQEANHKGILSVVDPFMADAPAGDRPPWHQFEAFVRLGMRATAVRADLRPHMQAVVGALAEIRRMVGDADSGSDSSSTLGEGGSGPSPTTMAGISKAPSSMPANNSEQHALAHHGSARILSPEGDDELLLSGGFGNIISAPIPR